MQNGDELKTNAISGLRLLSLGRHASARCRVSKVKALQRRRCSRDTAGRRGDIRILRSLDHALSHGPSLRSHCQEHMYECLRRTRFCECDLQKPPLTSWTLVVRNQTLHCLSRLKKRLRKDCICPVFQRSRSPCQKTLTKLPGQRQRAALYLVTGEDRGHTDAGTGLRRCQDERVPSAGCFASTVSCCPPKERSYMSLDNSCSSARRGRATQN